MLSYFISSYLIFILSYLFRAKREEFFSYLILSYSREARRQFVFLSYLILSYLILFYLILSYLIRAKREEFVFLSYLILSYSREARRKFFWRASYLIWPYHYQNKTSQKVCVPPWRFRRIFEFPTYYIFMQKIEKNPEKNIKKTKNFWGFRWGSGKTNFQ